jgi:hypothetical protein
MTLHNVLWPAIGAVLLSSCASYPSPQKHVAESTAAIRGATEVGAASQPQAALSLKLAEEELAQSKALMDDGKNEPADYMALRAKADAELALELARQSAAQHRAEQGESTAKAVEGGARVLPAPLPQALPAPPAPMPPVKP